MLLSAIVLFFVCCFVAVAIAVIVPAVAVWGGPLATAAVSAVLTASMPFFLRGHQRSIVIAGTTYVAAACISAYLAFGPVSKDGQWELSEADVIALGVAFLLWVIGLVCGVISYKLTSYPLILHLTFPLVVLVLFRVSYVFR